MKDWFPQNATAIERIACLGLYALGVVTVVPLLWWLSSRGKSLALDELPVTEA